jgi:hypothetical protein
LAERAGVSYATVQRAERVDGVPDTKAPMLFAIQRALDVAGVRFLDTDPGGGVGVRFKT